MNIYLANYKQFHRDECKFGVWYDTRLNGSLYHRRGLHRLTKNASPFTLVSFVSFSTKNLKSIKDHGINAKITGSAFRSLKNVRPITWAVRNKTAYHYETVSSTIKGRSFAESFRQTPTKERSGVKWEGLSMSPQPL